MADELKTTNPDTGTITYKDTTLRDVWNKSKALRATLSSASRTGSKTFSKEEYATIGNVNILTDLLKNKGMDLTEANAHWTQWSPLRKRIVSEIKPFDTEAAGKMPIESTLEKSVSPTSKGYTQAKEFVSKLEDQFKLPKGTLTSDIKDIVSKIDQNKLAKANIPKLSKEMASQLRTQKLLAKDTLDSTVHNAKTITQNKSRIKKIIIKWVTIG